MRANIEIDDQLMSDALAATGAKTKREVVEWGLQALLGRKQRLGVLNKLWGIDPHWGELPQVDATAE